jgi:chromosome segregation protein
VKLSRVEIRGFKSIAKKTALVIADGVTCIAGPNGCGKSNVIDAVRWCLGEQSARSLRASAMGDVIFSGTQDVGPNSLASVTLEFTRDGGHFPPSLDGFEQVSITRRLFRTGESEYLLNNVRCRLKDITDLFLDTGLHKNGYAIIEQGRVKDIIQAKPEDVRYLIEEAAEVGRFRLKRTEALRRLEATSKNLERIRDLLNEVTRQRNDLRSQANKARRYQELRSQANELSRLSAATDLLNIARLKETLEEELGDTGARISMHEQELVLLAAKVKEYEESGNRLKGNMESLAATLNAAENREILARRETESCLNRLKDIQSTIDMLRQGMEDDKRGIEEEQVKAVELAGEMEAISARIRDMEGDVKEEEEAHAALMRDYEGLERDYHEKRTELFNAIGEVRAVDQLLSELTGRHREVNSNRQKRQDELAALAINLEAMAQEMAALESELSPREGERPAIRQDIEEISRLMEEESRRVEADTQKMIALDKSHAEMRAKVSVLKRIVAPAPDKNTQPLQNGNRKVSEMLSVQAGFEEAVGRSMGSALDFLIFRNHEEILSREGLEKMSPGFVIEDPHIENHNGGPPPGAQGVIGPLAEFIKAKDGYQNIAQALSRNMYVVEGLENAVSLWGEGHRSCSFVTRDGMILESTGVIRTAREHSKYAEVLKAKTEITDLSGKMAVQEGQIAALKEGIDSGKARLKELKTRHAARTSALAVLDREIGAFLEKKKILSDRQARILDQDRIIRADIARAEELLRKFDCDVAGLRERKSLMEKEREAKESLVRELDERKAFWKQDIARSREILQEKTGRFNELKILSAAKQERILTIEGSLARRREEIAKDSSKIEELTATRVEVEQSLQKAQGSLDAALREIAGLRTSHAGVLPEYEKALGLLREAQENTRDVRTSLEQLERARNELLLKNKEYEIAYAMNLERLEARFGEGIPGIPESFDREKAREEIVSLEERIERMGQINFASIEEFDQVQSRWEDLHRQYEDIVRASTRLKEVISNIERQSIKAFNATFEKVKQNFQEIFTIIFGGGKADIIMTEGDGEEIDAGVEILASPPFKRLKAMSLLSEGEKTLCAISFMFALFKVNPSPFCILDEVDAPLDDANVLRLNRLIRTFSRDSQFIIVTHNRHTMEMADILYGVTFDIPGISKVVSMKMESGQE